MAGYSLFTVPLATESSHDSSGNAIGIASSKLSAYGILFQ